MSKMKAQMLRSRFMAEEDGAGVEGDFVLELGVVIVSLYGIARWAELKPGRYKTFLTVKFQAEIRLLDDDIGGGWAFG